MKTTSQMLCAALLAVSVFFAGCASSPIAANAAPLGLASWGLMSAATAGGSIVGDSLDSNIGGPVGAAVGLGAAATAIHYHNKYQAQLLAEAKEEARREERAKLMQDYWLEASGSDSVGSWRGAERDIRYDAGVYDGIAYERRDLPRQTHYPCLGSRNDINVIDVT
jgi:hypothetical protein